MRSVCSLAIHVVAMKSRLLYCSIQLLWVRERRDKLRQARLIIFPPWPKPYLLVWQRLDDVLWNWYRHRSERFILFYFKSNSWCLEIVGLATFLCIPDPAEIGSLQSLLRKWRIALAATLRRTQHTTEMILIWVIGVFCGVACTRVLNATRKFSAAIKCSVTLDHDSAWTHATWSSCS
jgi:hypothetical protein